MAAGVGVAAAAAGWEVTSGLQVADVGLLQTLHTCGGQGVAAGRHQHRVHAQLEGGLRALRLQLRSDALHHLQARRAGAGAGAEAGAGAGGMCGCANSHQ